MDLRKAVLTAAAFVLLPAINASADEALVFSLSGRTGVAANGNILIEAEVTENPGVQSWVVILGYDSSKADFAGIADGVFPGVSVNDRPEAGEVEINFFGSRDITVKGTAFTAEFSLKNGADSCDFTLRPSEDSENFFNFANEDIVCKVDRGRLTYTAPSGGKQDAAAQPGADNEAASAEQSESETDTAETPESEAESAKEHTETPPAASSEAAGDTSSVQSEPPQETAAVNTAVQDTQPEPSSADDTSAPANPEPSGSGEKSNSPETGKSPSASALLLALAAAGVFAVSRRR